MVFKRCKTQSAHTKYNPMFQIPPSNMIIKLKASFRSHIQLAFRRLGFPFSSFSSHIQQGILRLGFPLSSFKKNRVEVWYPLPDGMLEQSQTEIRALWQLKERAPGFESTRAHGYGLWAKENQNISDVQKKPKKSRGFKGSTYKQRETEERSSKAARKALASAIRWRFDEPAMQTHAIRRLEPHILVTQSESSRCNRIALAHAGNDRHIDKLLLQGE